MAAAQTLWMSKEGKAGHGEIQSEGDRASEKTVMESKHIKGRRKLLAQTPLVTSGLDSARSCWNFIRNHSSEIEGGSSEPDSTSGPVHISFFIFQPSLRLFFSSNFFSVFLLVLFFIHDLFLSDLPHFVLIPQSLLFSDIFLFLVSRLVS